MALLEDLLEPGRRAPRLPGAKLDDLLCSLEDGERVALLNVLEDEVGYPSAWIARVLRKNGHDIGATTVKAWRAREREA